MAVPESNDGGINHRAEVYQQVSQWWECVVFCQGIQRGDEIHITLYLYWFCRFSKSLWFGADQYCVEDEGVVAGVCDEEDGEGLRWLVNIFLRLLDIKEQGVSRVDAGAPCPTIIAAISIDTLCIFTVII